ncbi:MAG: hydantoinase B/oxoprolinase family protein [Solirubrobacteraceae bacterium]
MTPTEGLTASLDVALMANRMQAICREMTNTLQRSGRSSVLSMGRDFSVAIVSAQGELLVSAESIPVHVLGIELQAQAMLSAHPDIVEGDAYLHNDPYSGNTHHADHAILVPVFHEGVHVFTACAKAHQADAGNAVPTTYSPRARDIYEEGALNFPAVRVQRGFGDIEDIIRICKQRIRVPDQWYGDYLAALGAARIGERRLKELIEQHGAQKLAAFARDWFDYSERRMRSAIRSLPARVVQGTTLTDPLPGAQDGVELRTEIAVDPQQGTVRIDLRDNPDCIPAGINLSMATSISAAAVGFFNSISADVPHNSGSFRCLEIQLRENCIVGIPRHPTSCSMATTHVADRLVNMTQAALTQLGDGYGLAEGGLSMPPCLAVISGNDPRAGGAAYVNQLMLGATGGPGGPKADGWVNYVMPVVAGLQYRDSVEVDELKYPIHVLEQRLITDSAGAGRHRGAPGSRVVFTTKGDSMTVVHSIDGHIRPPGGVLCGQPGSPADAFILTEDRERIELAMIATVELLRGQQMVSVSSGGGGYGHPRQRDPVSVCHDVNEGWVSREAADEIYGVVLVESGTGWSVELTATRARRNSSIESPCG